MADERLIGADATVRARSRVALLVPATVDDKARLATAAALAWAQRAAPLHLNAVWLLMAAPDNMTATRGFTLVSDVRVVVPVDTMLARHWQWTTGRRWPRWAGERAPMLLDMLHSVWPLAAVHVLLVHADDRGATVPLPAGDTVIVCADGTLTRYGGAYKTRFDDLADECRVCDHERRIERIDDALVHAVQRADTTALRQAIDTHRPFLPPLAALSAFVRSLAHDQFSPAWCGRTLVQYRSTQARTLQQQLVAQRPDLAVSYDVRAFIESWSSVSYAAVALWPCTSSSAPSAAWDAWLDRRVGAAQYLRLDAERGVANSVLGPELDDGTYAWDMVQLASYVRQVARHGAYVPPLPRSSLWSRRTQGVLVEVYDNTGQLRARAEKLEDGHASTADLAHAAAKELQTDATDTRRQPLSADELRSATLHFTVTLLEPVWHGL